MKIAKETLELWDRLPKEVAMSQAGKPAFDRLTARAKVYSKYKAINRDPTETALTVITKVAEELWNETYRYREKAR